ncbi:MAG: HDIG domain-containing protein [Proteobacteria bacterium]|nr:HDIG domain-containing protein [Pseudomonadota bacterium]
MKSRKKGGRKTVSEVFLRSPDWSLQHPSWSRLGLGLLVSVVVGAMLVEWQPLSGTRGLAVDQIAAVDIRAPGSIEVQDPELTEEKRRQARKAISPVFEHDVLLARGVQERIDNSFRDMRAWLAEAAVPAVADDDDSAEVVTIIDPGALQTRLDQFERELGVELDETHLATLQIVDFNPGAQRDVAELVRAGMSDLVVLSAEELPAEGSIQLVRVEGSNKTQTLVDDFSRVRDLAAARRFVSETASSDFRDRPTHVLQAMVHVAEQLVVPNLRFDASETEVRRQLAARSVAPITTSYQQGQIIIRAGEPVSAWTLEVIEAMNAGARSYKPALHLLSVTLLLLLFLVLLEQFGVRFISKFRRRFNDLLTMGALLILAAATAKLMAGLSTALQDVVPTLPAGVYMYCVPVAVGGIVVRTLMNSETVVLWALPTAIVCTLILDGDVSLTIYFLGSAIAAAGGVGHASERGRLIRAGFVAALANVALVIAIDLVGATGLRDATGMASGSVTTTLFHVLFALAGGLVSGILAVGLVPILEPLGFVTDARLLELSNLGHPLIRDMIVKAPGTYHHSMVVGSLAEAAAEAIHANSLLVRVGAYFHDIGKMLKPGYFIENQRDGENPHDRLTPSMSALVITNHVKEGIELGIEHGLPEPIIDMIPQHHGTSRVSFFYNKALQMADPDKEEIAETAFRYPGPKAQTKEAAIMMLADGAEAATRSLINHTEGAIRARVSKIINSQVSDGQLNDCPLTLKDLHTVSETFIQVLMGIHHHRIEYPKPPNPDQIRAKGGAKGVPASSITLELPSMMPAPDAPHPLEVAQAEREGKEPESIRTTGELLKKDVSTDG